MKNVISIGRRLIAIDQIAFVEPFDPASATGIETSRKFEARLNLLHRDSCLAETTVEAFAAEHKFRVLEGDRIALNPAVDYRVEKFEPTNDFTPEKQFMTRVLWRDHRGNDHSKLLLTAPETVLAVTVAGIAEPGPQAGIGEQPERTERRRTSPSKRASRHPA